MSIRLCSAAYAIPPGFETVEAILRRERARVDQALRPLNASLRKRAVEGLGIETVRVCGAEQPYELAREAATRALAEGGLEGRDVDLIIDFSTLPGEDGHWLSLAQKLSAELGAETSLNLSYRIGGCAGLHLALKTAAALMAADDHLETALLVTADSPPAGSRSLMPVTIQGDAGSAAVLRKNGTHGAVLLATEILTLGHLYDAISLRPGPDGAGSLVIEVESRRFENEVMPIYYLNFLRLVHKALERAAARLTDIDHVIYSNLSRTDREGFIRAVGLAEDKVFAGGMKHLGHTFASDLLINYTDLRRAGRIQPGQLLLFASAGIGFTWGVSLARA